MQSIKYAAKIVFIWVLFYWSFEEQQARGSHLLTWVNSYKSLSMHLSLLVVMFFAKLSFRLPIATNQIQRFGLNAYILYRTTQATFL